MFSGSFTRGSEPTQLTTMSSTIDDEEDVVSNVNLAWLQSGRGGLRWKQPLISQAQLLEKLDTDAAVVRFSSSEKERVTSATSLGLACRSADPAVVASAVRSLSASLQSSKECEQRAAAYGLSVGGDNVVNPLLEITRDLLSKDLSWLQTTTPQKMTHDKGTGAGYTWHIIVNAVFALGSFWHLQFASFRSTILVHCLLFECTECIGLTPAGESVQTPSAAQLDVLQQVICQATHGIQDYLKGLTAEELADAEEGGANRGFYLCTHQVDFFVTQRRRAIACALNAIGFIGHCAVL